jgi:prevent-host-death family protein
MKVANVTSLKSRLSEYLRMVEKGQILLITDHGRPVAQIQSPPATSIDAQGSHLYRSGLMRPPGSKLDLNALDRVPLPSIKAALTDALLDERDGR